MRKKCINNIFRKTVATKEDKKRLYYRGKNCSRLLPKYGNNKKVPKGVYLIGCDDADKIKTIITVKRWIGLDLLEAKKLVESAPVLIKSSDITFNYMNAVLSELPGELTMSDGNPLEYFTEELDKTGCLYKIIYS